MVGANKELSPQQVLAVLVQESDEGEELLSCGIVVLLVLVIQLAPVADFALFAILDL